MRPALVQCILFLLILEFCFAQNVSIDVMNVKEGIAEDFVDKNFTPSPQIQEEEEPNDSLLERVAKNAELDEEDQETVVALDPEGKYNSSLSKFGAEVATVARIEDHEHKTTNGSSRTHTAQKLIDSDDNEYVLSNPKDASAMHEDHVLIGDLILLLVAATIFGFIARGLNQPPIFGFLVAGTVVGPAGFNAIREVVQIETICSFGLVFMMFALGVRLHLHELLQVKKIAFIGGGLQIAVMIILSCILAVALDGRIAEGVLIGSYLSMSSTAVVMKCLGSSQQLETLSGQVMLGMLVVQDIVLGLVLALLPLFGGVSSSWFRIIFGFVQEIIMLGVFGSLVYVCHRRAVPHLIHLLHQTTGSELLLLGAIGVCLLFSFASQLLGLPVEIGAFAAGLLFADTNPIPHIGTGIGVHSPIHHHSPFHGISSLNALVLQQLDPVRDLFSAMFFTHIGMVINMKFLFENIGLVVGLAGVVLAGKALLCLIFMKICGLTLNVSLKVAIGLAHVGEFSFVLAGKSLMFELISKRVYMTLLATTTVSLFLTPLLFKLPILTERAVKRRDQCEDFI